MSLPQIGFPYAQPKSYTHRLSTLGAPSFASDQFQYLYSENDVHIKAINLAKADTAQSRTNAITFAQILKSIDHPNVIRVLDYVVKGDVLYVVMEKCRINLKDYLQGKLKLKKLINESLALRWTVQFFQGYIDLESKHKAELDQYKHPNLITDFELSNIYLTTEGRLKIGHFHFKQLLNIQQCLRARQKNRDAMMFHSLEYNQMSKNKKIWSASKEAIWTWGVFLYMYMSGFNPLNLKSNTKQQFQNKVQCPIDFQRIKASLQTKQLIKMMLEVNEERRINFSDALYRARQIFQTYQDTQTNRKQIENILNCVQVGKQRKRPPNLPLSYKLQVQIASNQTQYIHKSGPFAIVSINTLRTSAQLQKQQQQGVCFEDELQKISKIYHQNVLRLYQYFTEGNQLYLVLQLCQNSLTSYRLKQPNERIKQQKALSLFRQILNGYAQLITKCMIHRKQMGIYILINNILIDGKQNIKLTDFRMSKDICNIDDEQLYVPINYLAPQIIKGVKEGREEKKYTLQSQVWTLGVILYEMIFGIKPWGGDYTALINNKNKHKSLQFPKIEIRQQTKELLQSMLTISEIKRISWGQLFEKFQIKAQNLFICLQNQSPILQTEPEKYRTSRKQIDQTQKSRHSSQNITSMRSIESDRNLIKKNRNKQHKQRQRQRQRQKSRQRQRQKQKQNSRNKNKRRQLSSQKTQKQKKIQDENCLNHKKDKKDQKIQMENKIKQRQKQSPNQKKKFSSSKKQKQPLKQKQKKSIKAIKKKESSDQESQTHRKISLKNQQRSSSYQDQQNSVYRQPIKRQKRNVINKECPDQKSRTYGTIKQTNDKRSQQQSSDQKNSIIRKTKQERKKSKNTSKSKNKSQSSKSQIKKQSVFKKSSKKSSGKPKYFKVTVDKQQLSKILLLKAKSMYSQQNFQSMEEQLQDSYCITKMKDAEKKQLENVIKLFSHQFQKAVKKLLYK